MKNLYWEPLMVSNKTSSRTMDIILYSSAATIVMAIIFCIFEGFSMKIPLFDTNSFWLLLMILSFLCSIGYGIWLSIQFYIKSNHPKKLWLYALSALYLSFVFFCINSSGGLTASPFISFYGTILAVGIIISGNSPTKININFWKIQCKPKIPLSLFVLGGMIILCLSMHLILQYNNNTGPIGQNPALNKPEVNPAPNLNQEGTPPSTASQDGEQMPLTYLFKYTSVILIALIATGVADYKSLNSTASDATIYSTQTPQDDKEKTT